MAEQRVHRRLAAILAADVVGYSRLMEADEAGTLARLKSARVEVFDTATARFGGRIFKTTGDGALAEFAFNRGDLWLVAGSCGDRGLSGRRRPAAAPDPPQGAAPGHDDLRHG